VIPHNVVIILLSIELAPFLEEEKKIELKFDFCIDQTRDLAKLHRITLS